MLPFENYGDEASARLANGVTEDIVTDLARFHDLDVIARNSTEVHKGKPIDVREVGKELNVGYVLEGSVQRQGDRIRITAQLIDTRSNSEISKIELQRAKRLPPSDLRAHDYFLLGKEAKSAVTRESVFRGIDFLDKAVALDPNLARAYSIRAWLHYFSMMFGVDGATAIQRTIEDAEKAVALDPQDAESLATLGFVRLYQGRYEETDTLLRTAVDLSPANSHVLILAAAGLADIGKPDEGARFADRALRLDPRMTPANLIGVKEAYYLARR